MTKGIPNKRYTGEFKQKVVEMMQEEGLSYCEAARLFIIRATKALPHGNESILKKGRKDCILSVADEHQLRVEQRKDALRSWIKKVEEELHSQYLIRSSS